MFPVLDNKIYTQVCKSKIRVYIIMCKDNIISICVLILKKIFKYLCRQKERRTLSYYEHKSEYMYTCTCLHEKMMYALIFMDKRSPVKVIYTRSNVMLKVNRHWKVQFQKEK